MGDLVGIHQKKRVFTLEEAKQLLPVIRRVTRVAHEDIGKKSVQLSLLSDQAKKKALEVEIQASFEEWMGKVKKLGCEAKGSWLVDFDNGEGYYCWHYPESDLAHFHGYEEGFQGRVKIP